MKKATMAAAMLSSYLLFGCALTDENVGPKAHFVGKKVNVLIDAIGEPKYTIDTTFDDDVASRALVYPAKPALGCTESYKIDVKSNVIIDYTCR